MRISVAMSDAPGISCPQQRDTFSSESSQHIARLWRCDHINDKLIGCGTHERGIGAL